MSREVSRAFDLGHGQCVVLIEDENKTQSVHTIHLLEPDGSAADVQKYIDGFLSDAAERAGKVREVAEAHGWKP